MIANFKKKEKGKFSWSNFLFQGVAILLIFIAVVLIIIDFKIHKRREELTLQVNFYQKQIEQLEKGNQKLKDEIANADNIDYLEKIAYEQLGEQKPGEKAVTFIAAEEGPKEAIGPENPWTGWLGGVWSWIKSKF